MGLIVAIDYTPWGNAWFGTAPLALVVWLRLLPLAGAMLVLEEVRKFLARRLKPRGHRDGSSSAIAPPVAGP